MAESVTSFKPQLDLETCLPLLRWEVEMRSEGEEFVLTRDGTEHVFATPAASLLRVLALLLDGRHTGVDLVAASGTRSDFVSTFLSLLVEHDLAVDINQQPDNLVEPDVFYALCRRLFPGWKQRVFSHDLWRRLTTGAASRSQLTGWLLESYHFIDGASDRIALAVAECPDPWLRAILAKHHAEEYDHGSYFLRALEALGLDQPTVRATRPLPGTRAVLDQMRHAARQDPVQYAVCSGFLESTGADRAIAFQFFDELQKWYGEWGPGWVEPLTDHLRLDEDYGHGDKLEEICKRLDPLPVHRASLAIQAGAELVETLRLWCTDILSCYSAPDSVPRIRFGWYRPVSDGHSGPPTPDGEEALRRVSRAIEVQSSELFLQEYWSLCEAWAEEVLARPFWNVLLTGRASPSLVLGWGVEFYHYVESANEHMASATAHCRDDSEMRLWLAEHYVEEYDHGSIFLDGLAECGLDRQQVAAAAPLASTRALVNYLVEEAIAGVPAYSGVFGVMQAPREGRSQGNVDRVYGHLATLYPFARPYLEMVRKHTSADLELGHSELLLERIVARDGLVDQKDRAAILTAARGVAERFVMFFDGILEYYGSPDAEVPRRPADIRGLL